MPLPAASFVVDARTRDHVAETGATYPAAYRAVLAQDRSLKEAYASEAATAASTRRVMMACDAGRELDRLTRSFMARTGERSYQAAFHRVVHAPENATLKKHYAGAVA